MNDENENLDEIENLEEDMPQNDEQYESPEYSEEPQQEQPVQKKFGQEEFERTLGNKNYYKDKDKENKTNLEEAEKKRNEAREKREQTNQKKKDLSEKKGEDKDSYKAAKKEDKAAKKEAKQANREYKDAKRNIRNNKIDNLKNKAYQITNPGEALKARAKNYAKDKVKNAAHKAGDAAKEGAKKVAKKTGEVAKKGAQKAGQAIAKGTQAAVSKIVSFIASNPYVLVAIAIVIALLALIMLIVVIFQDEDDLGATNANNVKVDYNINGVNSNTKVQLVNYDATLEKYTIIETIDLEKYIAGVAISNMGRNYNDEAMKAYIIAVRSHLFASLGNKSQTAININKDSNEIIDTSDVIALANDDLKRLENEMSSTENSSSKIEILDFNKKENVIRIKNTSESLTYWDYEKDLYRSNVSEESNTYIYSPEYKPTSEDSAYEMVLLSHELEKFNMIISEVMGMYALDSSGNVLDINCSNENIQKLNDLAVNNAGTENGKYTAILMKNYTNIAKIESARVERLYYGDVGEFSTWKQKTKLGAPWGNVKIGTTATIDSVGCLITSISMQIANSGVSTGEILDFNPGTFAKAIREQGCLSNGGAINSYSCLSKVVPEFTYAGRINVTGSNAQKYQKVKEYADQGYYIVLEVRKNKGGQHWVALDARNSNFVNWQDVFIWDPATNKTSIGSYKKYDLGEFIFFRANKEITNE